VNSPARAARRLPARRQEPVLFIELNCASRRGPTGATATGTINLTGQVDTPTTVFIQPADGITTVSPGNVTIPAGQRSASFTISVVPVTSGTPVRIDASLGTTSLESDSIDVTP